MQRVSTTRADIGPALLFAAVPLAFLAIISFYQVFVNLPAARLAREEIKNSFFCRAHRERSSQRDGECGARPARVI